MGAFEDSNKTVTRGELIDLLTEFVARGGPNGLFVAAKGDITEVHRMLRELMAGKDDSK